MYRGQNIPSLRCYFSEANQSKKKEKHLAQTKNHTIHQIHTSDIVK